MFHVKQCFGFSKGSDYAINPVCTKTEEATNLIPILMP